MDNHAGRPEFAEALEGTPGHSLRFSHTLQQEMMYVAVPLVADGRVRGAVRAAYPLTGVYAPLEPRMGRIVVGGLVAALLAALISLWLSRALTEPLVKIQSVARRFAEGDFSGRVAAGDSKELGQLSDALNLMAVRLEEQIGTITHQRDEENAVLSSMLEGVIAVDPDERIINMNRAAADLMGVDVDDVRDRSIPETIRNVDLQNFVKRVLRSPHPVETDIVIHERDMRFLQAHGTMMRDAGQHVVGALVVLNDVTRLRRLETVRRDFVANVSHELKTPITTIKGFVETLLDGATEDKENGRRFLEIIGKNVDRLTAIIEDLLSLSRIEQDNELGGVELSEGSVQVALTSAVDDCAATAAGKGIALELSCPEDLKTALNTALLQQAVVNLIDNAVKYSDTGSTVRVRAVRQNGGMAIAVEDQGPGIAEEHLPRLFERFYRVDKARSRELGGTGLGLAIVKHIVQAHRGKVEVQSALGEGSTFTIHLPPPGANEVNDS
jgi:two-component system phosphate regulon sensor histidine kinase PhoR